MVQLPELLSANFPELLTSLAPPAGLEPATNSLEGCCSIL